MAISLDITPRQVFGKQVRQLRRAGIIPGVVYGPNSEPLAVQMDWTVFRPILSQAGGTHLIDLQLEGKSINVLVRDVQRDPVRQEVLHVDFHAVDVNTPIHIRVPIVIPNLEAAAKRLQARIFQPLNQVEIACLPADIPAQIEVDLSIITRAGKNLLVGDLPALKGVTYLADDDIAVVRTVALIELTDDEEETEEDLSPEVGEVEVIRRGKEEEEEF